MQNVWLALIPDARPARVSVKSYPRPAPEIAPQRPGLPEIGGLARTSLASLWMLKSGPYLRDDCLPYVLISLAIIYTITALSKSTPVPSKHDVEV